MLYDFCRTGQGLTSSRIYGAEQMAFTLSSEIRTDHLPGRNDSLVRRALLAGLALVCVALNAPFALAQKVELSVDASRAGAKIDRNIFGQFAEHLGHGV